MELKVDLVVFFHEALNEMGFKNSAMAEKQMTWELRWLRKTLCVGENHMETGFLKKGNVGFTGKLHVPVEKAVKLQLEAQQGHSDLSQDTFPS